MKKKKSSAQGLPEYTGRYPKPKLRFRLRVVFFIFLSCLLIGLVFYLLGVNFDLFPIKFRRSNAFFVFLLTIPKKCVILDRQP